MLCVLLTWSSCRRCKSTGPCCPHCSNLLVLGPAGWSVLRCDSPDALSLVLAYGAAPNVMVSGDCPIRGKGRRASGAGATVVAPTAYKVIESDGRAEHRVWQKKFLCKWTEVSREAEQCYTETAWQWRLVPRKLHKAT